MLALNLALAFGLELVALAAFSNWGVQIGHNLSARILFGVGAPLVMVVVWGASCHRVRQLSYPRHPDHS